jgi:glycosyltransferase involved in cell wall biosynthesis
VDAVQWFFDHRWSTIRSNIPDAELVIIGSGPPEAIRLLQSENTIVEGHVKDLSKYFDGAVASVAPLRYGAGVKGKIVTSMHYGCPVVTTGIGAEGMGLTHGVEVLIGNDPLEFSQLVIDLCRDHQLRDRLVCNAAAYVNKRYSRESVASTMLAILSKLGVQAPAQ